jgi:hypothetical protein
MSLTAPGDGWLWFEPALVFRFQALHPIEHPPRFS